MARKRALRDASESNAAVSHDGAAAERLGGLIDALLPVLVDRLAVAVERRHDALAQTAGLNADVFDALVLVAAGGLDPAAIDPDRSFWFITFSARDLDYETVQRGPLAFVIAKNLRRRHLSESQRAILWGWRGFP